MAWWVVISVAMLLMPLVWARHLSARAAPKAEAEGFAMVDQMRRQGDSANLEQRMAEIGGPVGDFVRAWLTAGERAERVDLMCERLAEVDAETRSVAAFFTMLSRTVLAAGGLMGVVVVIDLANGYTVSHIGDAEAVLRLAPLIAAGIAAFLCHWIGRLAGRAVEERRRNWDRLCRRLGGPLMSGPGTELAAGESHQ